MKIVDTAKGNATTTSRDGSILILVLRDSVHSRFSSHWIQIPQTGGNRRDTDFSIVEGIVSCVEANQPLGIVW